MIRILAGVVTAGLLLCAGLLVGGGASVTYAGQTRDCAGPIVRSESASPELEADPVERGLTRACDRSDSGRLHLALLAGLLALGAGAVGAAAGKDPVGGTEGVEIPALV